MNSVYEYLFLRRPKIEYVCPALCEFPFSSSGTPIIVLEDIHKKHGPTGLILGGVGNFRLSWDAYPGALCYTVYKAVDELDPFGDYQIVAECISDNFIDLDTFGNGVYRVTAITLDGETDPSGHITFSAGGRLPLVWFTFEDFDINAPSGSSFVLYDAVNLIPMTVDVQRSGSVITPGTTGPYGQAWYGISCIDEVFPFHRASYQGTSDSFDPVNLADGFAIAFDASFNLSQHKKVWGVRLRLRDSLNASLGVVYVLFSSFGTDTVSFLADSGIKDCTGNGLHVIVEDATGTFVYHQIVDQTPESAFHQFVVNFDAANNILKVYRDNVEIMSGSVTLTGTCDHCILLQRQELLATDAVSIFEWHYIDELSVWPFKLTSTEINALWNSGAFQTWPMV